MECRRLSAYPSDCFQPVRSPRYALAIARKHAPEASVEDRKLRITVTTANAKKAFASDPDSWFSGRKFELPLFSDCGDADAARSAVSTCTGKTTKATTRTRVAALRQTIFNETSRISPMPSGRS